MHLKHRSAVLAAGYVFLAACGRDNPAGEDARPGFTDYQCVEQPCGPAGYSPSQPKASFSKLSEVTVTNFGSFSRTVSWGSKSEAIANVEFTTVRSELWRAIGCSSYVHLYTREASGAGSPLTLWASGNFQDGTYPKVAYSVNGYHSFTPVPGATGGGSFTSGYGTACLVP
jgi:hypothetical protein